MRAPKDPPSREKWRCQFCAFFAKETSECRKYPPGVFPSDLVHPLTETHWPKVAESEWCGEFSYDKRKDPDAPKREFKF